MFLTLPSLILSMTCAVALSVAKDINWKIKVTIINIFAAEITVSLGLAILYIGYPVRVTGNDSLAITCYLSSGTIMTGFNANLLAITFFAISVYIFIKYNLKKLKWKVIIASIIASWAFCIMSTVGVSIGIEIGVEKGFCIGTNKALPTNTAIFLGLNALLKFVTLGVVGTFVILTFCHARRNVSQENVRTKKAVMKVLTYHSVKMLFLLFQFFVGGIFPVLRSRVDSYVTILVITYVVVNLPYSTSTLITPIVSLIVLRPLREAFKQLCNICCRRSQAADQPQVPPPPPPQMRND
jgi:hypothetical protein